MYNPIEQFAAHIARLPGIGPRQALRIAYHLVNTGHGQIHELAQAVRNLSKVQTCSSCFSPYHDPKQQAEFANEFLEGISDYAVASRAGLCMICADPLRKQDIIAVIEKETDQLSIEKTKKFDGRYLLLGTIKKDGTLSDEQKRRLETLKKRMLGEVIIATNPTTYGDIGASSIIRELESNATRITRLGRGIPTGGMVEFADEETLGAALEKRS